jgi:predicted metalloprotease
MRWTPGGRSRNIEDRRGQRGVGGGFPVGRAGMGLGGTLLVLILSLVFGGDIFSGGGVPVDPTGGATTASGEVAPVQETAEEAKMVEFMSFVLDDAQAAWAHAFPQFAGRPYEETRLVLFRDVVQSECGVAQSASGPFYCPLDRKVYLDLNFFEQLDRQIGAPGDFAQAYVIAHEIGHHVQTLLGTSQQVRQLQQQNPGAANELSVRLELQADCYAGLWGYSARDSLEAGDIEEALNAASSIGDDRLQQRSGQGVNPESFTHGSAAQRVEWFRRGFQSGDPQACDTFGR